METLAWNLNKSSTVHSKWNTFSGRGLFRKLQATETWNRVFPPLTPCKGALQSLTVFQIVSPNHQFTSIHIDFGPPPRPTTTAAASAVPAPRHAALAAAPAFGAPRNRPTMRAARHTWQVKNVFHNKGLKRKEKNPNTQLWRVGEKIKSWSLMIMNPSFCVVPTHTCERLLKMWSKCFNTVGFSQFHGLWCFSYVCNATNRNHSHLWLITKWKSSPIPCQPNSTETLKRIAKNKSRHLEDNSCTFAADFSALFLRLVSTKNCLKKVESWKLPYLKFRCL